MKQRALLTLGLLVSCSGMLVWACGPDFPNQLLDNRSATLTTPPSNSFAFEVARILPATDALKAVENSDPEQDEASQAAATADAGEDVGLYAQGADRYRAGDYEAAQKLFSQVLALPVEKSRLRGVWAAYMLGQTYAAVAKDEVGTPAFDKDRQAAGKAFELARTRAVAGDADPQGLAVASFGEQAVLYLYAGTVRCDWSLLSVADPCAQAIPVADFKHAVALYAAQAGHGSLSAVHSLEAMASVAFTDSARTAALIDGPVTQRVLVAYALSRFAYVGDDGQPNPQLLTLVDAVQAVPAGSVAGLDRLASTLYAAGRYEAAGQLAEKVQSPLASWVKAKLALQKGDLPAAAQAYAAAAQAFPHNDDPQASLSSSSMSLLTGEQGVLALARGEYVEAMTHLYAAAAPAAPESASAWGRYFSDMEYIAERVLTVD